jgi:hypothetical protein
MHTVKLEVIFIFQLVSELGTLWEDLFLECLSFWLLFILVMSQNLMTIPTFDGTSYGYWKARMRFFLKSIDCWKSVEIDWIEPEDTNIELLFEKKLRTCQW